jgi:hypothetical protein
MGMDSRSINILNLTGELAPELRVYFDKKGLRVIDPLETDPGDDAWTHILTKDVADYALVAKTYQTIEKDIKLISLSAVENIQSFINANGKLIFCEIWLRGPLGEFIFDKFFQEYGGISLAENYPSFIERGSFNVINPFNTGEYLDRLVHSAFADGINALPVKTFFDHMMMYLTALKKQEKIGLPIEVHFGYYEEVFGVQLHFFTQQLELTDITGALSDTLDRKSGSYLLNVAVHSADFFDFSLLKEVNKTVVTALWARDERIRYENRGFLISELSAAAKLTDYPTVGVTSFQTTTHELTDLTDTVVISGISAPEEEYKQTISGPQEDLEDIVNVVKGKIEEEKEVFKIAGGKFDVDNFAYRISSGIEEKAGNDVMKVKALGQLPDNIKNSFRDFTKRLGKPPEELSEEDIEVFKNTEVPKMFKQIIPGSKKPDENVKTIVKGGQTITAGPSGSGENEKVLSQKLATMNAENETLKTKMKTLLAEVKILKDSKAQMAEMNEKAKQAAAAAMAATGQNNLDADLAMKEQFLQQLQDQKTLNEVDAKKLASIMEREKRMVTEAKENEVRLKKLQIEATQKESFFAGELEKLQRQLKARDLVISKSKESFTKLAEKKDEELREVTAKLEQTTKALASSSGQSQMIEIRELRRQIANHEKMIAIYKEQLKKPAAKSEEDNTKEENKKLVMLNTQMKNQLETAKRELTKFQERMSQDAALMSALKAEKNKMDQLVKKLQSEAKKEEHSNNNQQFEQEIKKLNVQLQFIDQQLKDSQVKNRELEQKLAETLKNQKKEVTTDQESKGKTAHLENNVRKLTQDLVESRNQLAEMKKETNKLRQEKTALQNQLDKLKKESDKNKPAGAKKPGAGGKAA